MEIKYHKPIANIYTCTCTCIYIQYIFLNIFCSREPVQWRSFRTLQNEEQFKKCTIKTSFKHCLTHKMSEHFTMKYIWTKGTLDTPCCNSNQGVKQNYAVTLPLWSTPGVVGLSHSQLTGHLTGFKQWEGVRNGRHSEITGSWMLMLQNCHAVFCTARYIACCPWCIDKQGEGLSLYLSLFINSSHTYS